MSDNVPSEPSPSEELGESNPENTLSDQLECFLVRDYSSVIGISPLSESCDSLDSVLGFSSVSDVSDFLGFPPEGEKSSADDGAILGVSSLIRPFLNDSTALEASVSSDVQDKSEESTVLDPSAVKPIFTQSEVVEAELKMTRSPPDKSAVEVSLVQSTVASANPEERVIPTRDVAAVKTTFVQSEMVLKPRKRARSPLDESLISQTIPPTSIEPEKPVEGVAPPKDVPEVAPAPAEDKSSAVPVVPKRNQFNPSKGQLVWARYKIKSPFWPAMVVNIGGSTKLPDSSSITVVWFNNFKVAVVPRSMVKPFVSHETDIKSGAGGESWYTAVADAIKVDACRRGLNVENWTQERALRWGKLYGNCTSKKKDLNTVPRQIQIQIDNGERQPPVERTKIIKKVQIQVRKSCRIKEQKREMPAETKTKLVGKQKEKSESDGPRKISLCHECGSVLGIIVWFYHPWCSTVKLCKKCHLKMPRDQPEAKLFFVDELD